MTGHYEIERFRQELVDLALLMQREHPEVGAIVLECTDMPPHTAAIQKATNLPVFDAVTLIRFIRGATCQAPCGGFL